MEECVVTFKNANRQIAMYFTTDGDGLNMQMNANPELTKDDKPDLVLSLASAFMQALNTENKDESETETPIIVS